MGGDKINKVSIEGYHGIEGMKTGAVAQVWGDERKSPHDLCA